MNAETKVKRGASAKADRATRQSRSPSAGSPPDGASVPSAAPSIYERLAAEFPRDAIHWRSQKLTQAGNKALALAYLDARDVQDRLDQVCTPAGWRNTITETPRGRVLSTIEILIDGQWVGKCDGAGDTAVEGEKGGISDAFKRSAVLWGIGRYLYRLPTVWAPCESSEPQNGGKRYFKKWIGSPWDHVPQSWRASTYSDNPDHDPITGEVIEQKGPKGISGIKERMRALKAEGNKLTDLDAFNVLVRENAADLQVLKDDNHVWWAGDGADDEGLKAWIKRRREEMTPAEESTTFQLLASTLAECTSANELQTWLATHGDVAETLDGEESRKFETLYDEKEAALKLLDQVTVGG
jgi:hypothetical protein